MTRDEILAALPGLPPADLKAVQAVITRLTGAETLGGHTPSALLYNALAACLGQTMPYAAFSKGTQSKFFTKNAPGVAEFVAITFPKLKSRVAEEAVLRLLVGLVIDDLKGRLGNTPSIGMCATNLPRIPELFENAYPGYRESGLAHLVTRVKVGGKDGRAAKAQTQL